MTTQNRIKTVLTIAVVAVAVMVTSANAALIDGLVEYWELDGDYSAEVTASHVGTLQATGTGSGVFVSGKFGQGIDLESSDGSNQASVVIGGDENDFDFAAESMSVALWYTTESLYTTWQTLVGKGENQNWRLARNSGSLTHLKFYLTIIGDGELDQQDGSWHHVVATADATNGHNLYVDGNLVASNTTAANLTGNTAAMQIGGNPNAAGRGWDGIMDDVGVWDRALTADEVSSIWNNGAGASIGSLTALGDPNAPSVDAGDDMITWSGEPVLLDPNIVEAPGSDWTNLTHLWSAEPDDGVEFSDPDALAPTVTITKATDNPSIVTLTLAVNNEGRVELPVEDTMTIDVYDDACLAAKAAGPVEIDPTDVDGNCITNFADFAVMATTWLDDYTLTGPVAK